MSKLPYPATRRADTVDEYHGVRVADPYRWLEDLDSEETRAWVEAQNRVTFAYLEALPARARIRERLERLWDYERFGLPVRRGGRTFYARNAGLQNQAVLYVADAPDAEPRVLLDPNALAADGTIALGAWAPSEDGRRLAYALAAAGSDWTEVRVRDVDTGRDLPDLLRWVKWTELAWTHDGQGFFYSRYPEPEGNSLAAPNYFNRLHYHRVGDDQAGDELVYERPDEKEWFFAGQVTDDGRYLVISVSKSTDPKNLVLVRDLGTPGAAVVPLVDAWEAQYTPVGNDGERFWFLTDLGAPRRRVVGVDLGAPGERREVVAQADETLESASLFGDRLVLTYLEDARSRVRVASLASGAPLGEVALPGIGTVTGFGGRRADRETFYAFTGFTTPAVIYRYDVTSGASAVFRAPRLGFDPGLYETEQVFYSSRDGTRVPLFLTRRRGLPRDGARPTLLYGYGGFGISMTPAFSVAALVWMESGGVYAVPCLRGGGEYGEDWHQAGTRLRKQNVFDDLIAAAEHLVASGVTRPGRIAVSGASNGGLLVGACMTQRPDLFGAALPAVGVLDMLRFHRFTIGWAWADDYGCADDPDQFRALLAYSPLHNLRPGTRYPATLITTADHDDRVVPAHSFKFAAALQAAQAGDAPVLIRIDVKAGHGAGKPTAKLIDEAADRWAFLVRVLGMD